MASRCQRSGYESLLIETMTMTVVVSKPFRDFTQTPAPVRRFRLCAPVSLSSMVVRLKPEMISFTEQKKNNHRFLVLQAPSRRGSALCFLYACDQRARLLN